MLPIRTLCFGCQDPSQLREAARLGVDAVVVEPGALDEGVESGSFARAQPPLTQRYALLEAGEALPPGFHGAVTPLGAARPVGALAHVVRVRQDELSREGRPPECDALWVRPRDECSAAQAFDLALIERVGRRCRLIVEVPDGAAGVEAALRLCQPYALLFGEGLWTLPRVLDISELERALAVVRRLTAD